MVIYSLDSMKKSSKKKETGIEKKIVELLQQATDLRKRTGKYLYLYESCQSFKKYAVLCGNNSVSVKIRDSLLCVTSRCMKVISK